MWARSMGGTVPPLRRRTFAVVLILSAAVASCDAGVPVAPEDPAADVLVLPVVVHVVHRGEAVGVGTNLSEARIRDQIRILNEDFRRKEGTPGHNAHPAGGDARIAFVLATLDPEGAPTDGIVRVEVTDVLDVDAQESLFDRFASYAYWDPERYINIWTMPLGEDARDAVLGMATGPETDLPGADLLLPGEPLQAEGILVNAAHFGPSDFATEHGSGRTLTHEMGHYLGLLHLWGGGDCAANDHCADTPAQAEPVVGCPTTSPLGCDGVPVMVENYMGWAADACMSTFTVEQIERMRYVLEHSPRRRALSRSPGLGPA